jgi:hypothetical protein
MIVFCSTDISFFPLHLFRLAIQWRLKDVFHSRIISMPVKKLGRRVQSLFARGIVQIMLIKSARNFSYKCDGGVRKHFDFLLLCASVSPPELVRSVTYII